jgi:hypothetical protein
VVLLEIEVVIICMRAETYLFNNNFRSLGLDLLLLFLLLVEELLVIYDLANGWLGLRCNFYQVNALLFCELQRLFYRVNTSLDTIAYYANGTCPDLFIDGMKLFLFLRKTGTTVKTVSTASGTSPGRPVTARPEAATTATWLIETCCYKNLLVG